jgi:hypothetical protein
MAGYNEATKLKLWGNVEILLLNYNVNYDIILRCQEVESATHILCDCETVAQIRFCHLGQFFMEPSDYYDAP